MSPTAVRLSHKPAFPISCAKRPIDCREANNYAEPIHERLGLQPQDILFDAPIESAMSALLRARIRLCSVKNLHGGKSRAASHISGRKQLGPQAV